MGLTKLLALGCAAAACVLASTDCRRSAPVSPPAGAVPVATGSGATVVRFGSVWVNEPRKSTLEKVAAEFRAQHPEIDLRIEYTQPDDYKAAIRTAVAGGDAPDVFFVWPGEWLRKFVRGRQVLDLTDELAKDDWGGRFIPNAKPLFEYRGRTWGVPMLMQCAYFLYNKGMFAERGLAPPKTWDELLEVCETFKREGISPIGLSNKDKWPLHHYVSILWQRIVGEDRVLDDYDTESEGAFSDPGYLDALRMVRLFADRGYFSENANGTSRETFRQLFASERVPIIMTGTWDLGVLQKSDEVPEGFGDKWDMFPLPEVPGGRGSQAYMMGAPDGYAVWADTKSRDAALTWLRFLTSPDVAQQLVSGLQELVCVKGAVNEQTAGDKLLRYATDLEAAPGVTPWADIMLESSVREAYLDSLSGTLDGTVSPEDVLTTLRNAHAKARAETGTES
jgi:raffinose/stachyose/melibiose transport system substrate-binding protein